MRSVAVRYHMTQARHSMLQDRNMEWKQWLMDRPSQLREEDTDWKRWLLGKPYRPFDPHVYLEFRLYKDFSSGIFDQWVSHGMRPGALVDR